MLFLIRFRLENWRVLWQIYKNFFLLLLIITMVPAFYLFLFNIFISGRCQTAWFIDWRREQTAGHDGRLDGRNRTRTCKRGNKLDTRLDKSKSTYTNHTYVCATIACKNPKQWKLIQFSLESIYWTERSRDCQEVFATIRCCSYLLMTHLL